MTQPTLTLYENPNLAETCLGNITPNVTGWKHRVTDWGGFDTAECDYHAPNDALWRLFLGGLGRRVEAAVGSQVVWDGRIQTLKLATAHETLVRSLDDLANQVKVIYFQMGGDIVTNGGAEADGTYDEVADPYLWPQMEGPGYVSLPEDEPTPTWYSHVTRSTAWINSGHYSFYVENGYGVCGGGIELACLENVVSGAKYQIRFAINVTSLGVPAGYGLPALRLQVSTAGGVVYEWTTSSTGEQIVVVDFTASAGGATVIQLRGQRELHFFLDSLILFENGTRKETQIYTDADSVARFGAARIEFLRGTMGDDQANAEALRLLTEYAWPRTRVEPNSAGGEPGLSIELDGFIHSLTNEFTTSGGMDTASNHIVALVGQSSVLATGIVNTNTLDVFVEATEPITLWDAIQTVLKAGDDLGNGARWIGGVYADRRFNYGPADTTARYRRRNGEWQHTGGVPLDPALMHPGLVDYQDMPDGPYQGRDPGLIYISAVEYDRDSDSVSVTDMPLERNRFGVKTSVSDSVVASTIISSRTAYISTASGIATHQLTGSAHTESGLTAGHVVRATSATSFAFAAIQDGDLPSSIARDSELHNAVTLATDADVLLGLSTQQLTLDSQNANVVLAGPASGAAADPTFRALVDDDIPSSIARDTEVSGAISTHAGDSGAHHAAVTLGSDADVLLGLSTQQLTLDSQNANIVLAGPATGAAADPTFRALAMADLPSADKTAAIGLVIDGGGSAITTGVKGDIEVPFACTIAQATLLADQSGSIVIDIWKDSYANYPPTVADTITASAKPALSSAAKNQDATLTGWTTAIAAGDILRFNVDSATTVTRVTVSLKVTKT